MTDYNHVRTILHRTGAVAIMPTDTVYGIVACANDTAAVARLYHIKHREHKPGTIIAASIDQLVSLGLKRRYLTAVSQFWPGAVSVIIPCGPELEYLHQGINGLAIRIPADVGLRGLLEQTGPLLTSSANHPGLPTATNLAAAREYFESEVDGYIDGGDLSAQLPSTIIQIVDDEVQIIREGAVTINL